VNCTSNREAWNIGHELLKQREIACFDLVARGKTAYYWPPKKGKIEMGKGTLLILVTLPDRMKNIGAVIKNLHKDKIPFYGSTTIENVNPDYVQWLKEELK
jgi:uncharacterized protein involved in tolerance to divalent cations